MERCPGFFSIEYTKSMESLHGIVPWVSRIATESTLGDSMKKYPGNFSTESKSNGVIIRGGSLPVKPGVAAASVKVGCGAWPRRSEKVVLRALLARSVGRSSLADVRYPC